MNRILKLSALLLGLVALSLVGPATGNAGNFTMKQCFGSLHNDFQGSYATVNSSNRYDVVNGCNLAGAGKLGIYQDRSGFDLTYGEGGFFRWDAPDGTSVIATRFTARLKDANGIEAGIRGFDGTNITDLDGGVAHDGDQRQSSWSDASKPQKVVSARVVCEAVPKCANQPASPKAFMEVTDVEFTVRDSVAPQVTASGGLWEWGGDTAHHRSSASIRVDASDHGSGVAAVWTEVNGLRVDFTAPSCPGDKGSYSSRFTPCPLTYAQTRTFNTAVAPFQEGANLVRVCVRDYAASESTASKTCSAIRTVMVDNQPSIPPLDLRSDEGTGWQPENGFTLRWTVPGGQKAPIVGAFLSIQDLDSGSQVAGSYWSGTGIETIESVEVPEVGAYRAVVSLLDGAFNVGQSTGTVIRFDDRPPGDVSPMPPSGWISKDELPLNQEIERAEAGGPSGVSGYALSVSDQGPSEPCGSGICLAPEITLSGGADLRTGSIGGLTEGDHWISASAVSGARRSSLEPGSTVVRVDRTPPTTTISGVPNDWVNHPVSVTVQASDELSGMQPKAGDDGNPGTVIDADNYAPYVSPGPIATFAVATEGVNRIRYWAEDLAGNTHDGQAGPDGELHPNPGQAVVRIDMTPPEASFRTSRDPEDPEVVSLLVEDADSGVKSASIGIRRAGTGNAFSTLPTNGSEGQFRARIPSDELAAGAYELNARVSDRAGNQTVVNSAVGGTPMIVNLPLKQKVDLTAVLGGGGTSHRAAYGTNQFIEGRLTSGGIPLTNQTLRIVEKFVAGSSSEERSTEVTTDGDGRYRLRLAKGPSRTVEASFEGTRKLARAAGPALSLAVKGRIRLKIKPRKLFNGGVVRMKGAVGFAGALPPARGKLVAIQFFDPTRRKWRPVEVLRTNRTGRFSYRYRFRTISSAQKIIFRANALPEAGWPYLPSTSKPRSVIVYPKDRTGR